MNMQKFGQFVAMTRKERGMTQAQLAANLRVTDKAVSRWERGLGFPDIGTLEPLADALGVTLLELMRSEREAEVGVSKEDALQALSDTLSMARTQRRRILRRMLIAVIAVVVLIGICFVLSGQMKRADVFLYDYTVLESGNALTMHVGLAGSMGYIRACRNVSQDPRVAELHFYSAFGGLNSSVGARNVFTVLLEEGCTEVCFYQYGGWHPVLRKNPTTGEWERVSETSLVQKATEGACEE